MDWAWREGPYESSWSAQIRSFRYSIQDAQHFVVPMIGPEDLLSGMKSLKLNASAILDEASSVGRK
jgi:hypothetical protein